MALAFFVASYFEMDPIGVAIYRPVANLLGLHMIQDGSMSLLPYALLMVVRLTLDMLVIGVIVLIQRRRFADFPLIGPSMGWMILKGLVIGFTVMVAAILAILAVGSAIAHLSHQSAASGLFFGSGWLVFDFVGALGEELAGRVAVILVVQPLIGWRGAILASGLLFIGIHIGNPGANWFWLLRLFLQGLLLAYAVYLTGSFWWSVGYHTGWNVASAPLFGAAGSGYLAQGHLFDFLPAGSIWITGGTVGPEGSVFAYLAMLAALILLIATTPKDVGFWRRIEKA
jgi:membrane protease YdiL (CAAX protease family)